LTTEPRLKVPSVRSLSLKHGFTEGGVSGRGPQSEEVTKMQTRSTTDHHHQLSSSKDSPIDRATPGVSATPEAELIALARSKGQELANATLQRVKETLELQGVRLEEFVKIIRPHFRHQIRNPSGFMISFARDFHVRSRPATASAPPPPPTRADRCESCGGEGLVTDDDDIRPCPKCSTPEFRRAWEIKEEARKQRRASSTAPQPLATLSNPKS